MKVVVEVPSTNTFLPSKEVCEDFCWLFDNVGEQPAVDYLCKYYEIKRMKVAVLKKWTANNILADYRVTNDRARFSRETVKNASYVLHEFFHHVVKHKRFKFGEGRDEEMACDRFAQDFLLTCRKVKLRKKQSKRNA